MGLVKGKPLAGPNDAVEGHSEALVRRSKDGSAGDEMVAG